MSYLLPAYEVSRRLCFQSFCPSVHEGGGGGGGVKIEKCSNKQCIKKFLDYILNGHFSKSIHPIYFKFNMLKGTT